MPSATDGYAFWGDVSTGIRNRQKSSSLDHVPVQVLSLTGELGEIIERRQAVRNCRWVFHRNGEPISDFRAAWKSALTKAGVTDYTFHDFRRTATRNMALAGVPEKHIMQVTGHKTHHMIDRYNITVERDTHNTLARTQAYLKQKHGQKADTGKDKEQEA